MIRALLRNAGIQPKRIISAVRGWPRFVRERKQYMNADQDSEFSQGPELPILTEWNESSGSLGAYFFQDQLVASWIFETAPFRHVDIGSRIDGFIGSLSVFREIDVIDIRPEPGKVRNVKFHQIDLMNELPQDWLECTDSLSCLHTIEHFGLGRYGDPIDPSGHLKGIKQLKKMVKRGGIFYLSTQIGQQRVEFNAHRVFSPQTVAKWFTGEWQIERSAVIDGTLQVVESPNSSALERFSGKMGVGIVAVRRSS